MIIHPAVRWPLRLAVAVAVGWALVTLLGAHGIVGLSGGLGVALVSAGRARGLRAADRAITTHTDPGPQDRDAADDRARSVLAAPSWDSWLGMAVMLAVAIACLVVAWVRDDPWAVVPGALLVVLAPVWWVLNRRGLHAAAWWLEVPPFDRAAQP